jgi:hydrogenase nickel incorporation protein HypB
MHETGDPHEFESILQHNEELAAHNREHFDEVGLTAINFMSAPGAGKTTLIGAVLQRLGARQKSHVIEGDMVGSIDSDRLSKLGVKVTQVSTGRSCHLDAQMVARVLHAEDFKDVEYLIIENVGNLVCPAEFPLGEHKRVVLLSITEGDDKPLKYPVIFRNCDAVVLSKCDLLPYVNFSVEAATKAIQGVQPQAKVFQLSATRGDGLDAFIAWLESLRHTSTPVSLKAAH